MKKFNLDYKKLNDYLKAFQNGIPKLKDLESIEVNDFRIFTEIELKGNVKF